MGFGYSSATVRFGSARLIWGIQYRSQVTASSTSSRHLRNARRGRRLRFRQNPLDRDAPESHAQIEPMRRRRIDAGEELAYHVLAEGSALKLYETLPSLVFASIEYEPGRSQSMMSPRPALASISPVTALT